MTSSDNYPNSYDLMAIEPTREILEKYLCDIKWHYEFDKMDLEEKKKVIEEISLEIDLEINSKEIKIYE